MMGLLPPQARVAGRARLEGQDLLGAAAATLRGRRVAMIFQDPMTSLTPHMRIGDQIAEPLVAHQGLGWRDARERAAALLETGTHE
jgi:ABC-type microcin C transport system duplicated ATPase subunit YejF